MYTYVVRLCLTLALAMSVPVHADQLRLRVVPPASIDCSGQAPCEVAVTLAEGTKTRTVTGLTPSSTVFVSSDKNCKVDASLVNGRPKFYTVSGSGTISLYTEPTDDCTVLIGERAVAVSACAGLQAALNAAVPGDRLEVAGSLSCTGTYSLDDGLTGWVRVVFDEARTTLLTSNDSLGAIYTEHTSGVRYWLIQNLHATNGSGLQDVIRLGTHTQTLAEVPEYIIFDNLFCDGTPGASRGCIKLHTGYAEVINSEIMGFGVSGADSNGIGGWNGPGPYVIADNTIQSCGYGMMLGGAVPSITNMIPENITVTRNLFTKDLAWEDDGYSCKNLLEFKAGRHISITYNDFENNWKSTANTNGTFLWLKSVNQNDDGGTPGGCTWCEVSDVLFEYNVATNVASGISLTDKQTNGSSAVDMSDVTIRNNYIEIDPDASVYQSTSVAGRAFMILGNLSDITIENNTVIHLSADYAREIEFDPQFSVVTGFIYRNNIWFDNDLGIRGAGASEGTATLNAYVPGGYTVTNNLRINGATGTYPAGNYTETTLAAASWNSTTKLFDGGSKYLTLSSTGGAIGWNGTGGRP